MPELPEIASRSRQMKADLVGKTISSIEVLQPTCLNVSPEDFVTGLKGARLLDVTHHGKWLLVETSRGWLLLNLGMGGDILLVTRPTLPKKYRLVFDFDDDTCLAVNFWWFGYAHYAGPGLLKGHRMTAQLGPNALDVTLDGLRVIFGGRRGQIKAVLLDQTRVAGIGNAYIHDILFLARLHPLRRAGTLSNGDIERLWQAMRDGLQPSLNKGGAFYETDLYGQGGGFTEDDLLVGYREGKPCPVCGTAIQKIKTGGTSSFVCPRCQL